VALVVYLAVAAVVEAVAYLHLQTQELVVMEREAKSGLSNTRKDLWQLTTV
jgi:hypothetical protein